MSNSKTGYKLTIIQITLVVMIGFFGLFYPGRPNAIMGLVGFLILLIGVFLTFWASIELGSNFTIWPEPKQKSSLSHFGPYRYIRHPIYSGLILFSIGWSLVSTSMYAGILSATLFLVLRLKSSIEESLLIKRFDGYGRYMRKTGKFFPRIKIFK